MSRHLFVFIRETRIKYIRLRNSPLAWQSSRMVDPSFVWWPAHPGLGTLEPQNYCLKLVKIRKFHGFIQCWADIRNNCEHNLWMNTLFTSYADLYYTAQESGAHAKTILVSWRDIQGHKTSGEQVLAERCTTAHSCTKCTAPGKDCEKCNDSAFQVKCHLRAR